MLVGSIIGFAFALVVFLLSRAFLKTNQQSKLMKIQGQEIEKHLLELQEQNEALLKSNHEKLQLISLVSHDLKGPFNRIFALIQLLHLSTGNLSDEQKEYLGKIHQIAADGLSMVRNLLDNRRIEDTGIELHPAEVDLSVLVSSLVKNYRTIAEKKNIRIEWEPMTQLIVWVDKLYLNRVIENLLSNAIKFSRYYTVISIRLFAKPDCIELSVEDQGPGISPEDQAKLFLRFQRLTARPTGGESSSGLGLFIVKSILNKMNGQIICESELGQGTKFIIRLPKKIN